MGGIKIGENLTYNPTTGAVDGNPTYTLLQQKVTNIFQQEEQQGTYYFGKVQEQENGEN